MRYTTLHSRMSPSFQCTTTYVYLLGLIEAAVVPASTSILSRSEADHALNTNYLFYRYPHIGSTTSSTFQPTLPSTTNFLQYNQHHQTSTTQMPHAQSSFQDVDAVAVLFKNGMFEPLWFSNGVEEQNEKRSANYHLIITLCIHYFSICQFQR